VMDFDLPAKKMYETYVKLTTGGEFEAPPWEGLREQDKNYHRAMAKAAIDNAPAPLFADVVVTFGRDHTGIHRHMYMDTTSESIDRELAELRVWLLELAKAKENR
jgi:hypothetical protein